MPAQAPTSAGLSDLADQTNEMAQNMAQAHKAAVGLDSVFSQILKAGMGLTAAQTVFNQVVERSALAHSIQQAISSKNLNLNELLTARLETLSEINKLHMLAHVEGELETDTYLEQNKALQIKLDWFKAQAAFAQKVQELGNAQLGAMALALALAGDLFLKQRQLNQNLIEANSLFEHRGQLLRETLMLQAQTGLTFSQATESARALVRYGMDTESSYVENVKLVAQMESGLGVAVDESAQLATIVERQLKGSFRDVANIVADLVENTALAGNEVADLAQSIGSAMSRLGPGIGAAGLPEVLRLVGRYESAFKEVGGRAGGVRQFLENLTTPGGITGMGLLGVTPEFLSTAEGVEMVMRRFQQFGATFVGMSRDIDRQFRLDILGRLFNVSATQANELLIMLNSANMAQAEQISLQDRWRNQMRATNQGLIRIASSLAAIAQTALYWPVTIFAGIINALADLLEKLTAHRGVVVGAAVVLGVLLVSLSASLINVTRQLLLTVAASNLYAAATARVGWAMSAAAAGSGAGAAAGSAAGIGGLLRGIIRPLVGLLSWWGLGLVVALGSLATVIAIATGRIDTITRLMRETDAGKRVIWQQEDKYLQQLRARLAVETRYGAGDVDPVLAERILRHVASRDQFEGLTTQAERDTARREAMLEAAKDIQRLRYSAAVARTVFTPMAERTAEQEEWDRRFYENELRMKQALETLVRKTLDAQRREDEKREETKQRELENDPFIMRYQRPMEAH